jgi:hypothetical protein
MIILRIEHKVENYEMWKKTFDSDPINRKQSGVRRHRIFQLTDDSKYVIIDLEFDKINDAEAALLALHKLWKNVEGTIMFNPQTQIINLVETIEY